MSKEISPLRYTTPITSINEQDYSIGIYFINSTMMISVPWGKVVSLTLEDNLLAGFTSGSLTLDNSKDSVESYTRLEVVPNSTTGRDEEVVKSFDFGEPDVICLLDIKPIDKDDPKSFSDRMYKLRYTFAVTDEKAVSTTDSDGTKWKTLELVDYRELILEKNIPTYTSGDTYAWNLSADVQLSNKSDDDRKEKSGLCIKHFLTKHLKEDNNILVEFAKDWEDGKPISYFSPTASNGMDILQDLIQETVSDKDQDFCIFRAERGVDGMNTTFSLRPFSDYCKGLTLSKELKHIPGRDMSPLIFTVAGQTGSNEPKTKPMSFRSKGRAQRSVVEPRWQGAKAISMRTASIDNYSYSDLDRAANYIVQRTNKVYTHDCGDKEFSMHSYEYNNLKERYQQLYIKHLDGQAIWYAKNDKNKTVNHKSNPCGGSTVTSGRNSLYHSSLAFMPSLEFEIADAQTFTQAGRWLTIITEDMPDNTKFQNKLNGEWLIMTVVHNFKGPNYTQNVVCNKLYTKAKIEEELDLHPGQTRVKGTTNVYTND